MDKFTAFLKKKGPLGMPMAFWAGFAAIALYLGYRWYSNRSGSSSSSSSTDTSATDGSAGEIQGGVQSTLNPSMDTTDATQPPESTTPGTKVTSGELNPSSGSGATSTTEPATGKKKKLRPKKKEATHHDHKQGTRHTQHKRVHVHHAKSAHSHAPHKKSKVHSGEKAATTKNVAKPVPVVTSGGNLRGARPAPAVKTAPRKRPPAPVHHHEPAKKAKPPLRKRTRA